MKDMWMLQKYRHPDQETTAKKYRWRKWHSLGLSDMPLVYTYSCIFLLYDAEDDRLLKKHVRLARMLSFTWVCHVALRLCSPRSLLIDFVKMISWRNLRCDYLCCGVWNCFKLFSRRGSLLARKIDMVEYTRFLRRNLAYRVSSVGYCMGVDEIASFSPQSDVAASTAYLASISFQN